MHDITPEEMEKRWYGEAELVQIKAEASDERKRQQRRSNWMMAVTCVLDEQQRQKDAGAKDPEELARQYHLFSQSAQETASRIGMEDARDVYGC